MFLLKNDCRFELEGVTFTVPKNYYIDADNANADENTLFFEPLGHDFQVSFKIDYQCGSVQNALTDFQLMMFNDCEPIQEIEHNGLKGFCSTFGNGREQYYEARFLVEGTARGCTVFEFTALTYQGNIAKIKESPEFKQLFDSIQKID